MATKTFKIGEYAKGGIIKVTTSKDKIDIKVIDMFDNEVIEHIEYTFDEEQAKINCSDLERMISNFLHEITTSYYTEKVMKWIKDKTGINFFWC